MISNELGIVAIGRNEGKRLINCLNSIRAEAKVPTVYVDFRAPPTAVPKPRHVWG